MAADFVRAVPLQFEGYEGKRVSPHLPLGLSWFMALITSIGRKLTTSYRPTEAKLLRPLHDFPTLYFQLRNSAGLHLIPPPGATKWTLSVGNKLEQSDLITRSCSKAFHCQVLYAHLQPKNVICCI